MTSSKIHFHRKYYAKLCSYFIYEGKYLYLLYKYNHDIETVYVNICGLRIDFEFPFPSRLPTG